MRNYFNIALVISVGIHIAIISGASYTHFFSLRNKSFKPTKIEFIKIEKEPKKEKIKLTKKISFKNPPPYLDLKRELLNLKKTKNTTFKKPLLNTSILGSKELVLIKSKENLDSFPPYINYYEKIRERIKKTAYQNFNYRLSGKVFLNFTIDNLGNLINIYLDKENSSNFEILGKIAKNSIEESSPFPEFPPQLKKFKTLTFNLSIHFKSN